MSGRSSQVGVALLVAQALWGFALIILPGKVLLALGGADENRKPKQVMRALGARHVLQATAELFFGEPALELGVWADELHAVTGFGFACLDARWRRAALTDAGITAGFAALGTRKIRDRFEMTN